MHSSDGGYLSYLSRNKTLLSCLQSVNRPSVPLDCRISLGCHGPNRRLSPGLEHPGAVIVWPGFNRHGSILLGKDFLRKNSRYNIGLPSSPRPAVFVHISCLSQPVSLAIFAKMNHVRRVGAGVVQSLKMENPDVNLTNKHSSRVRSNQDMDPVAPEKRNWTAWTYGAYWIAEAWAPNTRSVEALWLLVVCCGGMRFRPVLLAILLYRSSLYGMVEGVLYIILGCVQRTPLW